MAAQPELLPCPFCGGEVFTNGDGIFHRRRDGCILEEYGFRHDYPEGWNRRANTTLTWKSWDNERPAPGAKVVIVHPDESAAFTVRVLGGEGMIDDQNGTYLDEYEAEGAIWIALPEDTTLAYEATP